MARERIAAAGEPTDSQIFQVGLRRDVHAALSDLSRRTGKPMTWHARQALDQYLREQEHAG